VTLPTGWVESTIGEIAETKLGKMLDAAKNKGDLTPYLRNISVRWGSFDLHDLPSMPVTPDEFAALAVRDGDLFVCEGGVPGRSAVWRGGVQRIVFQKAIHRIRPNGGICPDYIQRCLYWGTGNELFDHLFTGTTIKHLPQVGLQRIAVPLPPLAEQRRIVAKLDALTARLARARAELDRVPVLAKALKASALKAAFAPHSETSSEPQQFDSAIDGRALPIYTLPYGWEWSAIGSVCKISGGLTKNASRSSVALQVPYLRVANVYANELRLDDVAMIGCSPAELQKTSLKPGDILVVEGNGSLGQVGRAAIWRGELQECSHQNHLIRVRVGDSITPEFVTFWLMSPEGRTRLENLAASTSGLHTLSISKIAGLPIPVPSLKIQAVLVGALQAAFTRADRLEAEAARARALLGRLEAAILARAFRGELVPQDPADEPAPILLARIRAKRAAAPTAKRGRKAKAA